MCPSSLIFLRWIWTLIDLKIKIKKNKNERKKIKSKIKPHIRIQEGMKKKQESKGK